MTVLQDKELILQAQDGDEAAFESILEQYYGFIYRVVLKFTGVVEDAEDITQLVCIKLAKNITHFNFSSAFTTWLYRVSVNACKDYGRKKRRVHSRELPFLDGFDVADTSQEQNAFHEIQELFALVMRLPEKLKHVTMLVYSEGLTHAQVAEILDCSEGTVSWRIHQAKKKLKKLAKDHGPLIVSMLMLLGGLLCR